MFIFQAAVISLSFIFFVYFSSNRIDVLTQNIIWLFDGLGFMAYHNLCRLFNAKSIFIHMNSFISNCSV